MPNHQFGSQTGSSGQPKEIDTRPPHQKRPNRRIMRNLAKKIKATHLGTKMKPRQMLTWTQPKTMTAQAKEVLKAAHAPETATLLFVAMRAVMSAPTALGESYSAQKMV